MARHFLILVVDDEPMICSMLRSVLEDVSDVTVLCAKDGKKALKMLTIIKPNLVLLDMMMPEVNGFEVIRQMKSSPTTSDIPVIALTASVSRLQALDAGCDGYLGKPFEIDYLLRTIAKYQARYLPPPPEG